MNKVIQTLWKLFLFSFPFSIHFVLYEKASYRFGNFSPWVTGFLFLPEILLFAIFVLWSLKKIRDKELTKFKWPSNGEWLLKLFAINVGLVTLVAGDPVLFLFWAIRIVEAVMVYHLVRGKIIPHQELIKWLLYGAVFQIILAYAQTRLNHSVGLHFLGEPVIGPDIPNVAKEDLTDGTKLIRAYGTFLHPNILGAYLMTVLFLSLAYLKKSALPFWIILLSIGVYLTGSLAAELTLILTAVILLMLGVIKVAKQKKVLSLGLLLALVFANAWIYGNSAQLAWNYPSVQERLSQNVVSLNMFLSKFWGVGVGNFTLEMEAFSEAKLLPWEFQPVHNAYLLILNETGIQGLIILILMMAYLLHGYWKDGLSYFLKDKARILPLFALMIIASFDHLLWTSWIGPILIGIVVAETTRPA